MGQQEVGGQEDQGPIQRLIYLSELISDNQCQL